MKKVANNPIVSVLMPVRNGFPYLKASIDSIREQSVEHWELICVDDHSTDETATYLSKIAQDDQRIKTVKNAGRGIIPALRLALSQSSGHFITRMDADDFMAPNKLEKMSHRLRQVGSGNIVVGLVKYVSETQLENGYKEYEKWLNDLTVNENNFHNLYKECTIPSPCWMTRKDDLLACGAFEPNVYPEDYDLAFRFRKGGLQVQSVNEVMHFWRDHPERTSRNDPRYRDNFFADLKVSHFLDQDYNQDLPLILWGAGKKGKKLAQSLLRQEIGFDWICNNERKYGHNIFGLRLARLDTLDLKIPSQVLVAVSDRHDPEGVLLTKDKFPIHTYHHFC